jgi:hypothetical protein
MTRYKGHPVRGAIFGFLSGVFLAIDIALVGAVQTDSVVLSILPVAGLVIGLLLGIWAPFGRAPAPATVGAPPDVSEFTGTPATMPPVPSGEPVPPPSTPPTLTGTSDPPSQETDPP